MPLGAFPTRLQYCRHWTARGKRRRWIVQESLALVSETPNPTVFIANCNRPSSFSWSIALLTDERIQLWTTVCIEYVSVFPIRSIKDWLKGIPIVDKKLISLAVISWSYSGAFTSVPFHCNNSSQSSRLSRKLHNCLHPALPARLCVTIKMNINE